MKSRILIFLLFFFVVHIIYGQKIDSLKKVLQLNIDDSLRIVTNQKLGKFYYRRAVYDSAFIFYHDAYIFAVENDDTVKIAQTLVQKANVKYWIKDYEEADSLFKKALFFSKLLKDSFTNAVAYNAIGSNKLAWGDTLSSINYLDSALRFCPKYQEFLRANIYGNLGQINKGNKKLEKSLYYFIEAEKIWKKTQNQDAIARTKFEIGEIFYLKKEYQQAISFFLLSLNKDTININKDVESWKYKNISDSYAKLNNFDSAYYYLKIYNRIYKEVYREGIEVQIKKIELDYEEKNNEKENKLLYEKNIIQKQKIRNRNVLIITAVLLSLIILSIAIVLFFNRKKMRKTYKILLRQNNKIQKQKENLEILNQEMFASSLKIDQQNIEVLKKNKEIKIQKDELIKKTIDLLVLNRELRRNFKLREGLTNMIVHDLKNPISNIISLSDNKEISFFSNEILTLVENILDVQKYEGVVMPLKKCSVSLKKIVIDAIKQVSLFSERKNVKIKNSINKSIIVYADEEVLRRVFQNFLSNAIKYSFANGTILLDYEIINNKEVIIKIVDNGVGIKTKKIHLIFNKFSQIMAKNTGAAKSTGLGLTFCNMAIKAHGGKVKVESEPNKFTMFSFNIELSINKLKVSDEVIVSNEKKEILIDLEDKMFLKPFYEQLRYCDVYEIGKLRTILKQIDENYSLKIGAWKKELNKAIYNCNFELYKELINKIHL